MSKLTCKAYAKLNLTLDITGVRHDGYHLMDMLMTTVSLYDTLTIEATPEGITASCDDLTLPTDMSNIVCKSAKAFFDAAGVQGGCHIHLQKRIPMQAGMGGGSSDGAAVLMALNKLYQTGLTRPQLCEIGVKVGADIPFIIMGGAARVRGIGDLINKLSALPKCWFVTCMPDEGISTKEAFAAFDSLKDPFHPATDRAQQGIDTDDYSLLSGNLGNAMEEALRPQAVQTLKRQLVLAGADAACMTGSGAAVFGIFKTEKQAMTAAEILAGQGIAASVCAPTHEGVEFICE